MAAEAPPGGLLRYRLALVAAGLLFSLGGLFIKRITADPAWIQITGYPAGQGSAVGITCYRSMFAALCLLPLVRGRTLPKWRDVAVAVTIYVLLLGLYIASTQGTTAANAIFLQYTAPLYALVLGPLFFREPFERADLYALAAAMLGIGVLFFGSYEGGERLPLLMGAGSGLMFGLFLLWLRRLRHVDPISVTAVNNLGVAMVAAALLVFVRPEELALVPRALTSHPELRPVTLLLVLMGVFQIAAPYVLFSYGLRHVPAVEGSLLALVEPLLNPVWVALFFGEKPTLPTLLGGGIIVLALVGRYTLFRPPAQEIVPEV